VIFILAESRQTQSKFPVSEFIHEQKNQDSNRAAPGSGGRRDLLLGSLVPAAGDPDSLHPS
jgi:hypothetical protein